MGGNASGFCCDSEGQGGMAEVSAASVINLTDAQPQKYRQAHNAGTQEIGVQAEGCTNDTSEAGPRRSPQPHLDAEDSAPEIHRLPAPGDSESASVEKELVLNHNGQKLGLVFGVQSHSSLVKLRAVKEGSFMEQWNVTHPEDALLKGDIIVSVNGQHDPEDMVRSIADTSKSVIIRFRRPR
mmetsp:Transcript_69204/g.165942  ORF Transcript_69204/g.165942 Transcript_69204/m.165942 type:complete len:182 (-) Transcript_69204:127-672(-)